MINLDKDQGKRLYKQTFEIVKDCVFKADWEGIAEDLPPDEFDGETARIVAILLRNPRPTVEELASGIARVYEEAFGGEANGTSHYFEPLAAEILRRTEERDS